MAQQSSDRLLGALPVAIATVDDEGTITYSNTAFDQLLPGTALVLDQRVGVPGTHASLRESGGAERQLRFAVEDGSERWGLASTRVTDDGSLLLVLTEVTDQHVQQVEREQLRQLAELPEKNPGPVGRLTREGNVLTANAAARRFLGIEEIQGRCWMDICPGMTWELWEQVLASDPGSDVRVLHEAEREGTCILFTHLRSESGDLVFVYGADITAQRARERQVAEMARFPEMNPGPVLRVTRVAEVLMANAAAREVFGEALIGKSWTDLCPGMDATTWAGMVGVDDVVPFEARIGVTDYVFTHRYDPQSQLVFVYGANVSAQKAAERALRQTEKLATLGTLAAGVAHELNNPAAATTRAAEHLKAALAELERARLDMERVLDVDLDLLGALEQNARVRALQHDDLGAVERSDRETEVEDWLDDHGFDDPWELAPPLVQQGMDVEHLDDLAQRTGDGLFAIVSWTTAAFRVHQLAHEIGEGSSRISEIVGALKGYSYLGQGPVQDVDVHEGIDNTLVILRSKLKQGVEVVREYGDDLPRITAYGSELNQVWTNVLDNAVDAMGGTGTIRIRTRRAGSNVEVEIADDGPGVPAEIQSRVFDPFFTTKEPGQGTGLGLATSYSIVTEKHRGSMTLVSSPGDTRFVVRLPVDGPDAPA